MHAAPAHRGFTILELSIVLVIVGLLAGSLLAGRGLVRSYELRTITTEKEAFLSSVNLFRERHNTVPGDFDGAVELWGQSANCGGASTAITATCNGNNNGLVNAGTAEPFLFWQHLANAGLLDRHYSGTAGSGGINDVVIGDNVPESDSGHGGWFSVYAGTASASAYYFNGDYNHLFWMGSDGAGAVSTSQPNIYGVVTPIEALSLDEKTDDGKPAGGKFAVFMGAVNPNCTQKANGTFPTVASDLTALYATTQYGDEIACGIIFRQEY